MLLDLSMPIRKMSKYISKIYLNVADFTLLSVKNAEAILFLAGNRAKMITGQIIRVSGGKAL